MITYLTQLLGKPAIEPDGKRAARVVDVIAQQGGRLPTITAVFLRGRNRESWVSLDDATIKDDGIYLRAEWESLPSYVPGKGDLRLQRDILYGPLLRCGGGCQPAGHCAPYARWQLRGGAG
jgi:hypothetical protein